MTNRGVLPAEKTERAWKEEKKRNERAKEKKVTDEGAHQDVLPHLRGTAAGRAHKSLQEQAFPKRCPHWQKLEPPCGERGKK